MWTDKLTVWLLRWHKGSTYQILYLGYVNDAAAMAGNVVTQYQGDRNMDGVGRVYEENQLKVPVVSVCKGRE